MHYNIVQPLQNGNEASIHLALVKTLLTIEPHGIFGSNLAYTVILILSRQVGMQNVDKVSPSISLPGCGHLVKMLITLEPQCII